ncbi:MAG: hypothetical protein IJU52_08855 [Clostridia bacterium]|nr:hypothetical protein [Clostridia bacterium]
MKRVLSVLSLLLTAVLLFGAVGALGVHADEDFAKKEVTAYIFSLEETKTLECVFFDALPEVPWIDPADYLGVIFTDTFTETDNGDGTFTVSCSTGDMVLNVNDDTVFFDSFDDFQNSSTNQTGSTVDVSFIKNVEDGHQSEKKSLLLDLSEYHIDLVAVDGKVYLPLPTIVDIFFCTYNNAEYVDGNIYFVRFSTDNVQHDGYFDKSSVYEKTVRTSAMAAFTYNELCFAMDHFYGAPLNAQIAKAVTEKGFDQALEDFSDETKTARQMLRSEDVVEYIAGLTVLSFPFFDGGHTAMYMDPFNDGVLNYLESPLISTLIARFREAADSSDPYYLAKSSYLAAISASDGRPQIQETRAKAYEAYETAIDRGDTAKLLYKGDTAVFVFDTFVSEVVPVFKEALDWASAHGIKNFVVDLSVNGGGLVAVAGYMLAAMTNAADKNAQSAIWRINTTTGNVNENDFLADLNLDGEFDDLDKKVAYDFNFAILTSRFSFSSGNLLPVLAKDRGIAILGQTSGGGACAIAQRYLADAHYFLLSSTSKFCIPGGKDVDLGAEPDYDLTAVNADGTVDYTGLYDFDRLGELTEEYYAAHPVETGADPLPFVLLIAALAGLAAITLCFKKRKGAC